MRKRSSYLCILIHRPCVVTQRHNIFSASVSFYFNRATIHFHAHARESRTPSQIREIIIFSLSLSLSLWFVLCFVSQLIDPWFDEFYVDYYVWKFFPQIQKTPKNSAKFFEQRFALENKNKYYRILCALNVEFGFVISRAKNYRILVSKVRTNLFESSLDSNTQNICSVSGWIFGLFASKHVIDIV